MAILKRLEIRKEVPTNCNNYLLWHTNSNRHVNMIINELTIKVVKELMGIILLPYIDLSHKL